MGLVGPTDAAGAARQLQDAIELGQITAQHAPAGHPIFAALSDARDALAFVQSDDSVGFGWDPAFFPGSRISDAIDGVYAAASSVRNAPGAPLPKTLWTLPGLEAPWVPIAAAGGVLALGYYLFRGRKRRGRR